MWHGPNWLCFAESTPAARADRGRLGLFDTIDPSPGWAVRTGFVCSTCPPPLRPRRRNWVCFPVPVPGRIAHKLRTAKGLALVWHGPNWLCFAESTPVGRADRGRLGLSRHSLGILLCQKVQHLVSLAGRTEGDRRQLSRKERKRAKEKSGGAAGSTPLFVFLRHPQSFTPWPVPAMLYDPLFSCAIIIHRSIFSVKQKSRRRCMRVRLHLVGQGGSVKAGRASVGSVLVRA